MVGPLALAASVDAVTALRTGAVAEAAATDRVLDRAVSVVVAIAAVDVAVAIAVVIAGSAMREEHGSARCGPFGIIRSLVVPLAAGLEIFRPQKGMRSGRVCPDDV